MSIQIIQGDCLAVLKALPEASVNMCVTSPPYFGLRDYGVDGQMGLEPTPTEYINSMVNVFRAVRRVLRDDGTLWLNIGDTYAANRSYQAPSTKGGAKHSPAQASQTSNRVPEGLKPKDLIGIPWRLAFALQADGWYLRQDIIWHKPNVMPESVTDRCTKAHEYLFLLSKSERYHFDHVAIKEPFASVPTTKRERGTEPSQARALGGQAQQAGVYGKDGKRNRRSVWSINTKPYKGAHFACFPPALVEPCVLAGCPVGGTVLDPFGGSGTTAQVAQSLGRNALLIELNPAYIEMAKTRCDIDGAL